MTGSTCRAKIVSFLSPTSSSGPKTKAVPSWA